MCNEMTTSYRTIIILTLSTLSVVQAPCNIFLDHNCASRIAVHENLDRIGTPTINKQLCDFEKDKFYLIPQTTDNTTCLRGSAIENGVKVTLYSDTIKITPEIITLPGCFEISFIMEINENIHNVPKSIFGQSKFDILEFPQIKKMQCQNASNRGCGGYGNNCYYCDLCKTLDELGKNESIKNDPMLSQFADIKCPTKVGEKFKVKRRFCIDDWSQMDKDKNCKLDFLEDIARNTHTSYKTLKNTMDILTNKKNFTLAAKFYLAHNETNEQKLKRITKENSIRANVSSKLDAKKASGWQISDADFVKFKTWYAKKATDKWNKEKYLPWLLLKNEISCIKWTFTVCKNPPVKMTSQEQAKEFWRHQNSEYKCF